MIKSIKDKLSKLNKKDQGYSVPSDFISCIKYNVSNTYNILVNGEHEIRFKQAVKVNDHIETIDTVIFINDKDHLSIGIIIPEDIDPIQAYTMHQMIKDSYKICIDHLIRSNYIKKK